MASLESAEPRPTHPYLKRKKPMSTNRPPPPEEPKPTNQPLSKFSYFTRLPAKTRAHIWTIAILRDLGAAQEAPPYKIVPTGTRIKRGEGGGGWGRARNPKAALSPPPAPEQPEQLEQPEPEEPLPRLHIIPFHTLPVEEPFTNIGAYLTAQYGEGRAGDVHAGLSYAEAGVVTAQRWARLVEGEKAVRKHARTRTLLFPLGRAPGTGAQFSGGWLRSALVGCCREAEAVADLLGRAATYHGDGGGARDDEDRSTVGQESLVGLGRGDVCCFVNVRADGSPIGWRDMLQLWHHSDELLNSWHNVPPSLCGHDISHDHLGLFPGGWEWYEAMREGWGCGDEMLAGVSGLDPKGLLPALAQCEVLAGVWHPAMCKRFRPGWRVGITGTATDSALCSKFKRDLESIPIRYPRLKVIYIIDPMMKPKPKDSLMSKPKPRAKFVGRGVTFYPAFSGHFMTEAESGYPYRHGQWRYVLKEIIQAATNWLGLRRLLI